MKSERRKRFEKVAGNRVHKILEGMRLLGNCANRNNYEYTKEDIEYMFDEIRKTIRDTQVRFESEINRNEQKAFKFKQ